MSARYLEIEEQISEFRMNHAPYPITLVAISKGASVQQVLGVYSTGCRDFGESSITEWLEKKDQLPADIRWHMVGPIQTKKIPKLVYNFALIHSVDTFTLLEGINSRSQQAGIITNVLLESNTSGEETKKGLTPDEWEQVWKACEKLKSVKILGLMTMAPFTDDNSIIRACFKDLHLLRDRLIQRAFPNTPLYHLSMGMSNDWHIAMDEGATLLRIGTSIFKS